MIAFAVLLILMQTNGCTVVTHFREYRIAKTVDDAPNGMWIYVSFSPTRHNQMRVPGIYDADEYRDPYRCHYTIWGPFDEIRSVEASFRINDGEPIPIAVDVALLNANRKLSRNGVPYFPAGPIPFRATSQETESIQVTTTFTARTDNIDRTYTITNDYQLTIVERTGNRWLSAIMSI